MTGVGKLVPLLPVVRTDHPHGRAKPASVEPLRDVAFFHAGNLHRCRSTPHDAQIAPHSLFELRPHRTIRQNREAGRAIYMAALAYTGAWLIR